MVGVVEGVMDLVEDRVMVAGKVAVAVVLVVEVHNLGFPGIGKGGNRGILLNNLHQV